jgi:hypothetical protein
VLFHDNKERLVEGLGVGQPRAVDQKAGGHERADLAQFVSSATNGTSRRWEAHQTQEMIARPVVLDQTPVMGIEDGRRREYRQSVGLPMEGASGGRAPPERSAQDWFVTLPVRPMGEQVPGLKPNETQAISPDQAQPS